MERAFGRSGMKIIVYGVTDEIENYTSEFWNIVDYIVSDQEKNRKKTFRGKEIKDFTKLHEDKEVFIIVSTIVNKQKAFRLLEAHGYIHKQDFVWGPEWFGGEGIPACYLINSWEENAHKYNFDGKEGPWDNRYKEMITLLDPKCSTLMDCGAGNMSLRRMINTEIKYYPVDNIPRYSETIVCDFNKGNFPDIYVDTAVACGILEYITVPEVFIKNLCEHSKMVLLSYSSLNLRPDISYRLSLGWKNHFTEGEIIKIFYQNKFILKDEIYVDSGQNYLSFGCGLLNDL